MEGRSPTVVTTTTMTSVKVAAVIDQRGCLGDHAEARTSVEQLAAYVGETHVLLPSSETNGSAAAPTACCRHVEKLDLDDVGCQAIMHVPANVDMRNAKHDVGKLLKHMETKSPGCSYFALASTLHYDPGAETSLSWL